MPEVVMSSGCHTFPSPLGTCTLCWHDAGVTRLHLGPGAATGDPAPDWVVAVARRVAAHLEGAADPLTDVPLDLAGCPPFHARVYDVLRGVGPGQTVTYGELAARVGSPGAARAVGQAVAKNPWLLLVPCHRVLGAGGRMGGFSAPGGVATKRRLLSLEGAIRG